MTLHDFTGAPCIGLPHIFEPTLQAHHERAKALCVLYRADGSKDTGELTWRRAQEAHAAYKAGERSEGTLRGERAYQRMRVERKKGAA